MPAAMSPTPGILAVTMQPSPSLPLPDFHAWYNNEHGPTRLSLPSIFANGLRYRLTAPPPSPNTASSDPEYLAVYDVKDMALLATPAYTTLRANRSPRESATIAQVAVHRTFYDLLHTKQSPSFTPLESLTDAQVAAGGVVTVAVEISLADDPAAGEEYSKWYTEEHAELLAKVPGWLRSRLFRTSSLDDGGGKAVYFCLHDYSPVNGLGGPEHTASMDTPWRTRVFDSYVASKGRRTYSLFYIFGPGPRDLASLAQVTPASAATFTSADERIRTSATSITSQVTLSDGLTLPYRLEGNPSPSAPVIAFCNSLLTSYAMWDPLVAILKQHRPDLRILRYDTRGRHAIPAPHTPATLSTVTSDLAALLAALRIEQLACLVGVSMGGATTLDFALTHPRRVAKFVAADFNCTSSEANTQAWRERIEMARGDGGQGIKTLAGQTVARWFHPDTDGATVRWMTDMVAGNDVEGFAHSCTALWDYDLAPRMGGCQVPGMFVVGETDGKGALVRAMEGFAGRLGKGDARLRIVWKAGHLPMCENPDGFWKAIRDFV